jgi:hypothetical protein
MGYYGMEKLPKGAKSSDSTGEKRVGASKVDTKGVPSTTGATPTDRRRRGHGVDGWFWSRW